MEIVRLNKDQFTFPDPRLVEGVGVIAKGGDLCVERLIAAYRNGIFPWFKPGEEILWWCPKHRYVIIPSEIHISRSVKYFLNKHTVEFTVDGNFADTIHRCRMQREGTAEGSWISDEIEQAYCDLHDLGYAFSVETFVDGQLAGGLYGVSLGKCYFTESMFTEKNNGSKLALIYLAQLLESNNYAMIDCQFHSKHFEILGGKRISYDEFKEMIDSNCSPQISCKDLKREPKIKK